MPFSSPGDLPLPGIEPGSLALQADSLGTEPPRKLKPLDLNLEPPLEVAPRNKKVFKENFQHHFLGEAFPYFIIVSAAVLTICLFEGLCVIFCLPHSVQALQEQRLTHHGKLCLSTAPGTSWLLNLLNEQINE